MPDYVLLRCGKLFGLSRADDLGGLLLKRIHRDLVSRKDHGLDVEPESRGSRQKRVIVRIAHDHAPIGRKDKAVEIPVIEGVVRRTRRK
jgi:hypothetical protein